MSYCLAIDTFGIIKHPTLESVCVWGGGGGGGGGGGVCVCELCSFVNTTFGEGIVTLYAAPNPFLLNKICLNQWCRLF